MLTLGACFAADAQAGCPLGATCDASYNTLAEACTAAGSGTLYITRAWNGLATANYCGSATPTFLGNGRVRPASGQTVTLPAGTICPLKQQCFDDSAGGTVAFAGPPASLTPQNFGAKWNGSALTDDTAYNQYALRAACAAGAQLTILPGISYNNTASGGKILDLTCTAGIRIAGAGGLNHLSVFMTTDTSGADLLQINSASGTPQVYISGISLAGSGSSSGHCLSVDGKNTVEGMLMDIYATGCKGSGKAGVRLSNVEDMSLINVTVQLNDYGLYMANVANLNTVINLNSTGNLTYNGYLSDSSGVTFVGSGFQGSVRTGLHLDNSTNIYCSLCWFEGNDTSSASGVADLELNNVRSANLGFVMNPIHVPAIILSGTTSANGQNIFTSRGGSGDVLIATTQSAGNIWSGFTSNSFSGPGTIPFRETVLNTYGPSSGGLGFASYPALASIPQSLECSGICTADAAAGTNIVITLKADSQLNLSGYENGTRVCVAVIEGGNGGYSFRWQTGVFYGGMSITTTPGAHNQQCFMVYANQLRADGPGTSN